MALQEVGNFSLTCQGGFVARVMFSYLDDDGNKQHTGQSGDVPLGQTRKVDPGSMGVPDGALTYLYVFVVWGTDNEATRAFTYRKGNPMTANYTISGTTLGNSLGLTGIS
jgi:hypothetical protein